MSRNAFLCENRIDSILHKKTVRILIVLISLVSLLVPFSQNCNSFSNCSSSSSICSNGENLIIVNLHDVKFDLVSVENIYVEQTLNLLNNLTESISSIDLRLDQSITQSTLTIRELTTNLNYVISNSTSLITIQFSEVFQANRTKEIKLLYKMNKVIPLYQSNISFYWLQCQSLISYYTYNHTISVRLPETSYIYEDGTTSAYFPGNATYQPGRRIIVNWRFENLYVGSDPIYYVTFTEPIVEEKSPIWIFILGPILGLASGVGGTIWVMKKREQKAVKKIGEMFLTETQKELLRIIAEKGGKVSQKELCTITGYTKTKISRNLISLEQQALVTKEKWGRNFRIFITDTGRKVVE